MTYIMVDPVKVGANSERTIQEPEKSELELQGLRNQSSTICFNKF